MRFRMLFAFVLLFGTFSLTVGQQDVSPISIQIQPVENNPVLPLGTGDAWDSVSIRFPQVIYHDGIYHMFYTAFTDLALPQAVGYATSDDGIHWTRYKDNPILEGSGEGFDAFGVNRAVVMVEDDGTWVMYYNGNARGGAPPFGEGIGRATAPAPTGPWTRSETPVLEAGSVRRWDSAFIFPDAVLKMDDGYVMFYSGNGTGKGMVGRATSPDGITWTKYDDPATADTPFDESDPVLMPGSADDWDRDVAWGSSVQITDHGFEMFYSGGPSSPHSGAEIALGYASSEDGITWVKYADNPVVRLNGENILFTSFVKNADEYLVYYGAAPATGTAETEPNLARGSVTFTNGS